MGQIVTFYSYKGGTGRSMLLANVAWILASNKQRVLVVDWDLEAPGLHRYYSPFLTDPTLESSEGIIDMLSEFALEAMTPVEKPRDKDWYTSLAQIADYAVAIDFPFEAPGKMHFVPAGKQSTTYASRVNSFDWQRFYDKLGGGAFLEAVRKSMSDYDWVLIDSRTGVSDTAGICTVQMPDTLVVCFTYNNQSIDGASGVAESVIKQRQTPIRVFPIPTRVEDGEQKKLDLARLLAQERFAKTIEWMEEKAALSYWSRVEVPYARFYAYEEILATFGDRPGTARSVLEACEWLTDRITKGAIKELPALPETERREWLAQLERGPQRRTQTEFKYDVFLSYAPSSVRNDPTLVDEIVAYLRENSLTVFTGENMARAGDAIASSRHMVAMIGGRGVTQAQLTDISAFFSQSLGDQGATRKLLPVLMPGTPVAMLPTVLQQVHALQFSEGSRRDVARQVYEILTGQVEAAPPLSSGDVGSPKRVPPLEDAVPDVDKAQPTSSKATPWTTRRVLFIAGATALAATAIVLVVMKVISPGQTLPPDGRGSGSNEASLEHRRDELVARARQANDPLLAALILREIPEVAFRAEDAVELLDRRWIPQTVFEDVHATDAELSSVGNRILLYTDNGVVLADTGGVGQRETIPASGLQLAFFLRDGIGVGIVDDGGVRIRRSDSGALEPVGIAGDPKHFVAAATDLAGQQIVLAANRSGVDGTRDSIYLVRRDQRAANRLMDSKFQVAGVGFIDGTAFSVRSDGVVSQFEADFDVPTDMAEPNPKLNPSTLKARTAEKAAIVYSGKQWAAWWFPSHRFVSDKFSEDVVSVAITQKRAAAATQHEIKVIGSPSVSASTARRADAITSIAISEDVYLLAGTSTGLDLYPIGSALNPTRLDIGEVRAVRAAREGSRIVAVFADGTAKVWNLDNYLALKGKPAREVRNLLYSATWACLSAEQRQSLLDEPLEVARQNAGRCRPASSM